MADDLVINARVTLPARDLSWHAVRASGKGGQNVNKVATKVELTFDVQRTNSLSAPEKTRLRQIAGPARIDGTDRIHISSDRTRSQAQNLADARARLRELVLRALLKPKKRVASKPSRRAKQKRLDAKHRHGEKKRTRQSHRFYD